MKTIEFSKGIECKLKNRHVAVLKNEVQNGLFIGFKILLSKEETLEGFKSTLFCQENRGIVETGLNISYEAGIALYKALGEFIKLSDIPSHLLSTNKDNI